MKKAVLITLDEDVHKNIKILYQKERKNLSNQINTFLIGELKETEKENDSKNNSE